MKDVILFHKPQCESCERLQKFLTSRRIAHKAVNGMSAEGRTFMLTHGVFLAYFPALCISGRLYEYSDLFSEKGEILVEHILEIVK